MKANKQSLLLIMVLITIVLIVEGITLSMLYRAAFEQQRAQLTATAQSQTKLMSAIARSDKLHNKKIHDDKNSVTDIMLPIRDAHLEQISFGESGEILIGKIENTKIKFLIPYRFKVAEKDKEKIHWLQLGSSYAEPMQLALSGKSGTIIARDYRGVNVLAAYEPINILNYGLVVKVDINEIRKPYVYVGIISIVIALILIIIGVIIFLRITNPIVKNLEVSTSRLNDAQHLAKVGSWELDLLTGNLIWSDEIFNIFEIDKTKFEATYETFLNAIHPDDRDKVNQNYSDSLVDRKPYEISHRLQMSDGRIKYVHETCESFFDQDNKPIRSVGTVQDVTLQNNLENSINTNRARFEAMFESMPDAVIMADIDRHISLVNNSVKKLFGYSKNELLGNVTSMLYANPDDFSQTGKQRFNLDSHGDPLPYEIEYRRKDGTVFWGETIGTKIVSDDGTTFGFVGIIRDITERKVTSQALQQFKSTLDQTLDCVFLFDAKDMRFYYVNEGAMQQVGYSYIEMMTMHPYNIKPEISKNGFIELVAPLISGEKASLNFETVHQHKNGKLIPVDIFIQYITDGTGTARFVAIVRDITDRKEIQAELEDHREHLEDLVIERTHELHVAQDELVRKERLATLGQLTATVSHELRNPLGAMRPSLYIIEKKSNKSDEKMQNAIQRVDRNIDRCDRIIDELLDFTRITELNLETTNIDRWLESVISDQIIPEGILLKKNLSLKDIELDIDAECLRRAIINVFDNSCHSMMDDNQQLVTNKNAQILIDTTINNQRIEINITDKGIGMADDVLTKIFEPLFSTKGFGVGLGMPTVKQIMEQHGGGVNIESEAGNGTTVTLWLPVST